MGGICNYAIEIALFDMICILSFMKMQAFKSKEAVILVLLKGGIFEGCHLDRLRCRDIHTKFNDNRPSFSSNIKVYTTTTLEAECWYC
jgi:hypothetical protein